jgi:hypothetical protein
MVEIEKYWSLADLAEAHMVLDSLDEAEIRAHKLASLGAGTR